MSHIQSVSIESPLVSLQKAICQYPLAHAGARFIFPNYDPTKKTIMEAVRMPQHVPIFIGSWPGDTVSKHEDVVALVNHLRELNSKIYFITTKESSLNHG